MNMKNFAYQHLPAHLQAVSKPIGELAKLLNDQLPDGVEKETGLRKLLEAKDCFVREAVDAPNKVDAGRLSDGYHSFNELYEHRMFLFAVISLQNQPHAWKSKLHHDGTMHDDYFITGINTPNGQFTYHYPMMYWDLFAVTELEKAPEWDGHTSVDVNRLLSLGSVKHKIDQLLTTRIPILDQIYELCQAIEKCGASPELTNAVRLAGELRYPITQLVQQAVDLGIGQGIVAVSYSGEGK